MNSVELGISPVEIKLFSFTLEKDSSLQTFKWSRNRLANSGL